MRTWLGLVLSCLALVAGASAGTAASLTFSFSFTNSADNGGAGLVRGLIFGLEDNAEGPATSVLVAFNEGGDFGLGEYVSARGVLVENTFKVENGMISTFDFDAPGSLNAPPGLTCCSLSMERLAPDVVAMAGLSNRPDSVFLYAVPDFTFNRLAGAPPSAPVPLPAPLLMLGTALAGLVWLGWKRRAPAVPAV